ncbi:hypothetical protein [Devosia aurantiaca]|uniref:Uncharacterized protein n=1 Tax=Devosia aurantiaca TaxID=2714858 RepID=A0A6M1SVT3_9HYPH|nr:hypothetical protein [Devosia aurantiaca]NGP17031.1 hypothetical protein [Devosia aurantiaca]
MTSPDALFPDRDIKIKRTGVWPGLFRYLGALMLIGLAVFFAIWQGPGIVDDWMIAQDPVIVEDALITNGECSISRAVFVDCSAHVSYEVKGKEIEKDIELMFLDFGSGDYAVDVVRSEAQPAKATLSLGLGMLWNRTITVAVIVGLLAVFGLALFRSGLIQDRNRRLARRPSRLTPVAVPVTQINKVVGGSVVQYQYGLGKKQQPLLTTSRFRKNEGPLWLGNDGMTALAVLPTNASVPILLDNDLERLDLSASERAEVQARLTPREPA